MKYCGILNSDCGIKSQKQIGVLCRSFTPHSAFRIPHSKRGFTLIDALVFIVIAGILLPAIVVPFATAVKGSVKPEMVNTAMYLAHQRQEELLKFDYNNPFLNTVALTAYVNAPAPGYQWQWEILYLDSNFNVSATDLGYKRIFVRVSDPENDTYEVYSVVTRFP